MSTSAETLRIGVYVCHCEHQYRRRDQRRCPGEVRRGPARRRPGPALQYVLGYRPGTGQAGHPRAGAEPHRGGGLLAQPARTDLSPRRRGRRPEPLPGANGQHPRASLLGDGGQGRRAGKASAHLAGAIRRVAEHEPCNGRVRGDCAAAMVVGGGIAGIERP